MQKEKDESEEVQDWVEDGWKGKWATVCWSCSKFGERRTYYWKWEELEGFSELRGFHLIDNVDLSWTEKDACSRVIAQNSHIIGYTEKYMYYTVNGNPIIKPDLNFWTTAFEWVGNEKMGLQSPKNVLQWTLDIGYWMFTWIWDVEWEEHQNTVYNSIFILLYLTMMAISRNYCLLGSQFNEVQRSQNVFRGRWHSKFGILFSEPSCTSTGVHYSSWHFWRHR